MRNVLVTTRISKSHHQMKGSHLTLKQHKIKMSKSVLGSHMGVNKMFSQRLLYKNEHEKERWYIHGTNSI